MRRIRPLLVAVVACGTIAACEEQLESGVACPSLCPQQAAGMKDTTFDAVEYDTAIAGYPPTGAETELLFADRPGVLDARVIVRFDTLPAFFKHTNFPDDSAITSIDSVIVRLRISRSDTLGPSVTIDAYDVDIDTTGIGPVDDTTRAALLAQFTPDRVVGSRTFTALELGDSIAVPIDPSFVLDRILDSSGTGRRRLRLGFKMSASQPAEFAVHASNAGYPPVLFIRQTGDSTIQTNIDFAYSSTPATDRAVAAEVADFQLIAAGPPPPPPNVLRVGGAPANRVYLRFNVPSAILDSSDVVRASLLLTQRPNPGSPSASDTDYVTPFEIVSGAAVTDIRRALVFLGFSMDSISLAPGDSAVRSFEVIDVVRRWRGTSPTRTPRSLALRANREGRSAWQADFFGRGAPPAVRPQLRLTYIPQSRAGLP